MHLQRLLTAIVAIPFLLLLVYKAKYVIFSVFIFIVSLITLYEYFRITLNKEKSNIINAVSFVTVLTAVGIICAAHLKAFDIMVFAIVFNLMAAGSVSLYGLKKNPEMSRTVAVQVMASIYIPLFLSFVILIRDSSNGINHIMLLFFLVFIGDTGAYYVGKNFGKHSLIPWVSPKKTVEGFLGGLFFSILSGCIFKHLFLPELAWVASVIYFVLVATVAPLGDLFESTLKRAGDIKDSGKILPGHGGILDRIDALLFGVPVTYFFIKYIF